MTTLQTPTTPPPALIQLRAVHGGSADTAMIESWAGGAGWSLGRGDLALFTRHHPDGLLIGMLDDRPVSAMMIACHHDEICFISAPIVNPAYTGRRIQAATAAMGLSYLADRTVAVEAPPHMREFFAARGFYTCWRSITFAGPVPAPRTADPHVLPMDTDLLHQVAGLDTSCFPTDRTAMAIDWAREPGRQALGYVKNDRLVGYGVIRPGFGAARIGPLYATEPHIAAAIFDALAERAGRRGARSIAVDIPEPNPAARALCETRGLSHDTETLRMLRPGVRAGERAPDLTLLYGLTSRELG